MPGAGLMYSSWEETSCCKRRSLGFVYMTGVSRLHNGMARRLEGLVHALIEHNYSANLPKLATRTGDGYIDYQMSGEVDNASIRRYTLQQFIPICQVIRHE